MGDQQPTFDFSKLNFDLSGGGGGFNFQGALQGIQAQLGGLIGADSGYFDTLPKVVQRRVRALRNLDREYEKIEEEFEKELKELELKYHKERFTPLFQKRTDIVTGKVEPTDEEAKEESDDEEEGDEPKIKEIKEEGEEKKVKEEKEETEEEKNIVGVPEFWLTALKHHEMLDSAINEKDEEALKYLIDITHEPVEEEQGSFTLKFHFKENPFFTNEVLTKTYHLEDDEGEDVVCESVDSTAIAWKEGKDLTAGTKGFGPGGSFFHFFAPPSVKEGKAASSEIVSVMEFDFELAISIKEEVIKHAVHWFTGEASVDGMGGEEDDEEGFGGAGEEDDDDEEDDGEYVPPEGGENKSECKQQ